MAESINTTSAPEELLVGNNKWGKLLSDLKVEVTEWKKGNTGISWDKSVWTTDKIRKDGDELVLIRNNTTYKIATLKAAVTAEKKAEVPVMNKTLTVKPGDSISKILTEEFGKGNFQYGDKGGITNMKGGWDRILIGEKLLLATTGQKNENDVYIYTLSREKNGQKETITFVSSKQLLDNGSGAPAPTTVTQEKRSEPEQVKNSGSAYIADKKEWDSLDDNAAKLKSVRIAIKNKNPQLDTSKWEPSNTQNEWNVAGKSNVAPRVYKVDSNGKAKEVNTD